MPGKMRVAATVSLLCTAAALKPVVVTGATGRVGRLVVDRLVALDRTVHAVVRDTDAAREILPSEVELIECDLGSADSDRLTAIAAGADSVIWCASGFNADGKLIDIDAIAGLAQGLAEAATGSAPKCVLCSSAGVSRPAWPEEKKARLIGASDIPIIRLNPGGILDQKVTAEDTLRQSGVPYCIVRPTGLKDDWPSGRPVLSQGDVAVGRTQPTDLAEVLVGVLDEPAAAGKTFEMFTLTGYPAGGLTSTLEGLQPDAAPLAETAVDATYRALQQMLPGEQQDATKLEMGRTYEAIDAGEVAARERGAAPTQRELAVASGALASMSERPRKRDTVRRWLGLGK